MDAPKHAGAESSDAGAARRVIQKRQLAHPVADPDDAYRLQSKRAHHRVFDVVLMDVRCVRMSVWVHTTTCFECLRPPSLPDMYTSNSESYDVRLESTKSAQPSGVNQASTLSLFA